MNNIHDQKWGGYRMYLSELNLYNFRRFKTKENDEPGLTVKFHPGVKCNCWRK